MSKQHKTIRELAADLAAGRISSVELTQRMLARAEAHRAQGGVAYVSLDGEQALAEARASDAARAAGIVASPLAGIPISIKDLFDVKGQVSSAASLALADAPPASADATAVARLRAAGAILLGRTNMSEFAFSGLGLNPHYGTPVNPLDGTRVAGGSSSGAAVSVALDMAVAGLGTDTGGSIRIPSAFCGLTGFKPSANRVPMGGTFPLAPSLDSVGPLARSVGDCVLLDAILSGEMPDNEELPLSGLQLAVTRDYVLEGLDAITELAFEAALRRLVDAGAQLRWFDFPELHELPQINAAGGLVTAQAWHLHREWLKGPQAGGYDPLVAQRIRRGEVLTAYDYLELERQRQRLIEVAHQRLAGADAWLLPTVAIIAPHLSELQSDEETFFRINAKVLRNPSVINFLDGCALNLPCQEPGAWSVGLSVAGLNGADRKVLGVSRTIERYLGNFRSV